MSDEKTAETPKTAPKKTPAARAKKTPAKKTPVKKAPAKKSTAARASTAKPAARKAAPKKTAATQKPAAATKSASESVKETGTPEPKAQADNTSYTQETPPHHDSAQILEDLKGRDWPQIIKRALLMFFFGVIGSFALYLAFVLAVAQVGFSIFAGKPNSSLTHIMGQCATYIRDVLDYLSFASDECPFPFGRDLPGED